MNINLSEEFTSYIKDCVESGYYQNGSEVIRDALRHMMQSMNRKQKIPNAKTLAAFKEVEEGKATTLSYKEFQKEMEALKND